MSEPKQEIEIECKPVGGSSNAIVVVKGPDGPIHTHKFDLAKAEARAKFVDDVCERCPGIDRDAVLRLLDEHAATSLMESDGAEDGKSSKQADLLVRLVLDDENVELFHSKDPEAFVTMPVGKHRETWRVSSKGFREWLSRRFYAEYKSVPGSQAMQDALGAIAGIAKFDGKERPVHIRIAEHEGDIWLDLCDAEWRAVRITPFNWRIETSDNVPVRFIRRPAMEALPAPVLGGSIEDLRPLVNLPDDRQWALYVGWLVGAFRPRGPYGVLAVSGEQGSAKTTLCKLGRRLIDPSVADMRRPPKNERDVFITGSNAWIFACNNVSGLRPEISDALCALATDGGFATRQLYSNDDEAIFSERRPVILNGIDPPATRSDLVDRSICLVLTPIPEGARVDEDELMRRFEAIRPGVLGALLTAVSAALRNRHKVKLARRPRMADLATWVTAAEEGLGWKPGTFLDAFMGNRAESQAEIVETSAVGPGLIELVRHAAWEGTAIELLAEMNRWRGNTPPPREWPESGRAMGSALRRLAPNLRAIGISVEFAPKPVGREKRKLIYLEWVGPERSASTASSADGGGQPLDADHADHADGSSPTQSSDETDAEGSQP